MLEDVGCEWGPESLGRAGNQSVLIPKRLQKSQLEIRVYQGVLAKAPLIFFNRIKNFIHSALKHLKECFKENENRITLSRHIYEARVIFAVYSSTPCEKGSYYL